MKRSRTIYRMWFICLLVLGLMAGCAKSSDNCLQNPDPGTCLAYFPKYYFDQSDGMCKEFIWGGCGGTVPFNTLQECETSNCHQ